MKKIMILIILALVLISCSNNTGLSGGQQQTGCICTENWDPVCGEDGNTYSNACNANCAKVSYTYGACGINS